MTPRSSAIPATPPSASINRIRVMALPGLQLDAKVRGERAYNLLSGPALVRYAQEAGTALGLPDGLRAGDPTCPEVRRRLPRLVADRINDSNPEVRKAAHAIARRLGRNLGFILLTLQRGDAVNRAARPDWPAAAWDDWAAIRCVWLGGGISSGALGEPLVTHANALLRTAAQNDAAPIVVKRTPHPNDMGMLGVSRYLPPHKTGRWHALCLDLGQTSAKRAIVTVDDTILKQVTWLPALPVPWQWRNDPAAKDAIDGKEVLEFVAHALTAGFEDATREGVTLQSDVAISIAAYTRGGTLCGNGIYARMHQLGTDARALIADRVTAMCGVRPQLQIVHDGTAAATLHAGETASAVIVIGTALGVGFPPASGRGLIEIAPDLRMPYGGAKTTLRPT